MKTIITFVTLFFVATAAVGSAALYLNENYILSGALCILCLLSVSFWIKSAGVKVTNTEKA
jgi:hypothetical protein